MLAERRTIRRQKDELGTATGSGSMTDERLEWHLLSWKSYMCSGEGVKGYPRRSIGLQSVGQTHFDDMAAASDRRCAMAVNAIIEGLPPAQAAALFRQYLWAVFRFNRDNFALCLQQGRERVRLGLQERGIW